MPGARAGVGCWGEIKLNESRWGRAIGASLTGSNFEGEKAGVSLKQRETAVAFLCSHPKAGCGSGFFVGVGRSMDPQMSETRK